MGTSFGQNNPSQQIQNSLLKFDEDVIKLVSNLKNKFYKSIGLGLCVGAIFYLFFFLQPQHRAEMKQFQNTQCVICQESHRQSILLPCLHFIMCNNCAGNVDQCPMCRSDIEKVMNIVDFLQQSNNLFVE